MAERGEGAAAGGSHLRATPSGTHTAKHRGRLGGVAATAGGVEGLEAAGSSPLPIRKRKIGITDVLEAKRRTPEEPQISGGNFGSGTSASQSGSSKATSPSSSSTATHSSRKRRRVTISGSSNTEPKYTDSGELWAESPNKRQQRSSNVESRGLTAAVGSNLESQGQAAVSLAANAPTTPTRNQASAWLSTSRGRGRKKTLSAVQIYLKQSSNEENDADTSKTLIPVRQSKRLKEKNDLFNESATEETSTHSSGGILSLTVKGENVAKNKTESIKKTESAKKAAALINRTLKSVPKPESDVNTSKGVLLKIRNESHEGTRKGFRVTVIQNKLVSKKTSKITNGGALASQSETAETSGTSVNITLRKAKNTSQIKGFNKRKIPAHINSKNQENSAQGKNGKVTKPTCSSGPNFGNQIVNTADILISKCKSNSKLGNSTMIRGGLRERVGGANVPDQKNSTKFTSKKVVAVSQKKVVKAGIRGDDSGGSGSSNSTASFEKSEKSSGGGGILKSYPLRNRLRLSDGGGGGGGGHGGGGGSPLGTTRHFEHHQSQSLPSSPSSQGVAFLADTFRRLRDSRRSSQEQSAQSTSKRNSQSKDPRQATGTWKRTHGTKKSPLSSKRSSRSKTNNTGSCASSSQQGGRGCGKVSFGSSSGMSGSHGPTQDGSSSSSSGPAAASHQQGASLPCTAPPPGAISSSVLAAAAGGNAANASLHTAPSTSTTSSLLPTASLATLGDSESEESDMGRLEALLASRGLPPSLFGALGPRMQHMLHRSVSSSISSKAQQLLVGLQASGDESEQLQAVIEMCQLLVMGNEDTLAGFPIKQVTPALINLLNMEHNFDMMNHACRALTYMMEALPRSSAVVVDAVPVFLEKLQVIQCMDVAEQSLTALDMLSRKHSKNILQAHGVSACLMFIDFFSTGAQRAALSVTANCCQNLTADEFHYVADSLQLLSNRLTSQGDKKCVESVCLAYSRLVDCFQNDPNRLQEIAGHGLLNNVQQLLVMSPPVLSTVTFIMVMRMLSLMCNSCPQLAVELLKNNIANTLCYLLTNSTDPPPEQVELVSRTPQELYEITCLISELMPMLPSDGIFAIDGALQRPTGPPQETVTWQWQDDRAAWQNYSITDSRIIEMAHQSGEDEISLCIQGPAYTIDFHSMQQINDSSGTVRSVQRRLVPAGLIAAQQPAAQAVDARATCLQEDAALASNLIRSLFSLLYEVYSSSAGPAVRYKCLRALLRMIHFSTPQLLQQVLKTQMVSSHLATMLSSHDLKIIVGAIQMTEILMQKLPEIFSIYFRREGVMHQIKRLCDPEITLGVPAAKWSSPELSLIGARGSSGGSSGGGTPNSASPLLSTRPFNGNCLDTAPSLPTPPLQSEDKLQSPQMRISDVLKRKRTTNRMRSGPFRKSRQEDSSSSFSEFFMKNAGLGSGRESWRNLGGGRSKLMTGSNSSSSGGTSAGTGVSPNSGKTASFLSSLNPSRWGRCNPATTTPPHDSPVNKDKLSNNSSSVGSGSSHSSSSHISVGGSSNSSSNKEVVRVWVRDQAQRLNEQYFTSELQGTAHPALSVLNRLIAAIQQLDHEPGNVVNALSEISRIVSNSDISPFEVIHSGLVRCLLTYLTATDKSPSPVSSTTLDTSNSNPLQYSAISCTGSVESNGGSHVPALQISNTPVPRELRLRNFLHVFLGCPLDSLNLGGVSDSAIPVFSALVSKLNGCVNQLEQFPVKVHDLPGTALTGVGRGASTSAIKFFNTHQLKCNLQRHPDCSRLRQWRGGPVKVDPLALVQAIERYLVIRGYGRLRDDDEDNSDDDNSDEDIDDTLAAVTVNQSSSSHKLQFVIGDHVLPYNMTVYQAIRQFSSPSDASASEADTDTETPVSHSAIWLQTHTIYYRAVQEEEPTRSSGGRKGKASGSKPSPKKKADANIGDGSIVSGNHSVLEQYLQSTLPASVTVIDPSIEVLGLLRVLHAINRHYGTLYPPSVYPPPLPTSEFTNLKLSAKASRQLQDPLVIMTGNVPPWLPQIAYACPFLFPFETRQLLFYAVSFDRDRALQRLMDSSPELNSVDSSERVTPRLERRKRTVSRDDILKQAEAVINDLASSRAMLEIQYENEVGTGLGPTLEFYALVSRELQKADLELWRGDTVTVDEGTEESPGKAVKYVNVNHGLYPLPIARNIKSAHVTKLKSKFRFLGKFMAKAVMDSRMLDLGLHPCVYKWLLGEERSLGLGDVSSLDPSLGNTLNRLHQTVMTKRRIQATAVDEDLTGAELQERLNLVTVDGCPVEDLALSFTLPGYPHIEFRKGGADMAVTINNIDQYLQLVIEWLVRDGVWRQMEALREGFESVFPIAQLQVFYPEELEQLFCGSSDSSQWDVKQLAECCRPDHGYTHSSRAVKFLLQILAEYNAEQQRSFLQFVTGSPRLPVGGFRSLSPALTIVRKTFEASENPDVFLPSVMTCVNYLKLPDYSSIDIMRAKLEVAAREGQHSFHLS